MYGHEKIIAMRIAGKAPKIVFLNDYPSPEAKDWHNPGEQYGEVWQPDHATVCTFGDKTSTIDLRFLKGLTVSITATSEGRAKALFALAMASGAETVAAGHSDPSKPLNSKAGWQQVWRRETNRG